MLLLDRPDGSTGRVACDSRQPDRFLKAARIAFAFRTCEQMRPQFIPAAGKNVHPHRGRYNRHHLEQPSPFVTASDLLARSLRAVWHPCTQMKQHERLPLVPIARGEGVWLYDTEG